MSVSRRAASSGRLPPDPVGEEVAGIVAEIVEGAKVELVYAPSTPPGAPGSSGDGPVAVMGEAGESGAGPAPGRPAHSTSARGSGPPGWDLEMVLSLGGKIAPLLASGRAGLREILDALPDAAVRTAAAFRPAPPLTPSLRRVLRDALVAETLSLQQQALADAPMASDLIAETLEYLIELGSTRVEAHELTHGVVITDVVQDQPRLEFAYPSDVRTAKRAPLLFDGQRSVLVVDRQGRARTELQRHRLGRLTPEAGYIGPRAAELVESGSLVAEVTRLAGGVGFFLRVDRSIWVFSGGRPVLIRRGERWTAFPVELAAAVSSDIAGAAADLVVGTAFMVSAQRRGAILAIVEDVSKLGGVVSLKDRYDLRDEFDRPAMRPETRLHHLVDAAPLDELTLARLAGLDGATIVDRQGNLLAYGAIVTSSDSQHEGARTAAARTLSQIADVVLKVSVDGDITFFREGEIVATPLW